MYVKVGGRNERSSTAIETKTEQKNKEKPTNIDSYPGSGESVQRPLQQMMH